jgi:hypothetical protein
LALVPRRTLVLVLVAALAGLGPGAAGSRSTKRVLPRQGEIVRLAGSPVECSWDTLRSGVEYIACSIAKTPGRATPGSYRATLTSTGRISVIAVSSGKVVFSRSTASAATSVTTTAHVGDRLLVTGTPLSCTIVNADGAAAICYRFDNKGPRPNAYGFALGRRTALVLHYTAGRLATSAGAWRQPAS